MMMPASDWRPLDLTARTYTVPATYRSPPFGLFTDAIAGNWHRA